VKEDPINYALYFYIWFLPQKPGGLHLNTLFRILGQNYPSFVQILTCVVYVKYTI